MKTEIKDNIRKFIADKGKVITDKDRSFFSTEIYPAASLTENDFEEVAEEEVEDEKALKSLEIE